MLFKGYVKSEMGMSWEEFISSKPNSGQIDEMVNEYKKDCSRRGIKPLFDLKDKTILKGRV